MSESRKLQDRVADAFETAVDKVERPIKVTILPGG